MQVSAVPHSNHLCLKMATAPPPTLTVTQLTPTPAGEIHQREKKRLPLVLARHTRISFKHADCKFILTMYSNKMICDFLAG